MCSVRPVRDQFFEGMLAFALWWQEGNYGKIFNREQHKCSLFIKYLAVATFFKNVSRGLGQNMDEEIILALM